MDKLFNESRNEISTILVNWTTNLTMPFTGHFVQSRVLYSWRNKSASRGKHWTEHTGELISGTNHLVASSKLMHDPWNILAPIIH
jgi:hypothetical protein